MVTHIWKKVHMIWERVARNKQDIPAHNKNSALRVKPANNALERFFLHTDLLWLSKWSTLVEYTTTH